MIPTIAIPTPAQLPPPVQTSFLSGVPTETSATARLPFYAVPSSVADVPVYHNGRGGASYQPVRATVLQTQPASPSGIFDLTAQEPAPPPAVTPYTSSFMAQVIGQNDQPPANVPLIQLFFQGRTAALQPRTETPSPVASVLSPVSSSTVATPVQQLQSALAFAGRQLQDAPTSPQNTAASGAGPITGLAPPKSLVRGAGVAGYQAAQLRSAAHTRSASQSEDEAQRMVARA